MSVEDGDDGVEGLDAEVAWGGSGYDVGFSREMAERVKDLRGLVQRGVLILWVRCFGRAYRCQVCLFY